MLSGDLHELFKGGLRYRSKWSKSRSELVQGRPKEYSANFQKSLKARVPLPCAAINKDGGANIIHDNNIRSFLHSHTISTLDENTILLTTSSSLGLENIWRENISKNQHNPTVGSSIVEIVVRKYISYAGTNSLYQAKETESFPNSDRL
ncbi:hypothetical protein LguiA_026163 [Lonicera macranthoides]